MSSKMNVLTDMYNSRWYGVATIHRLLKWLRFIGSLNDSFAEYSLFYGALLQKRPIILRSLLIVAIPYQKV